MHDLHGRALFDRRSLQLYRLSRRYLGDGRLKLVHRVPERVCGRRGLIVVRKVRFRNEFERECDRMFNMPVRPV